MEGTLLVTGGAGFIGSAVVRHLIAGTRARVVNVDALTYAASPESVADAATSPRYDFARVDVRDGAALTDLLARHGPVAVLHLAAETHVDRSIDGPATFLDTNVVGTLMLLEAVRDYWTGLRAEAREGFRLLHVSTDEVYGSLGRQGVFTEESPYRPRSPYAATKAAADHLVMAWHHTYGVPAMVTNCSNNYGPYQFPEKLIPHMILSALEDRPLPVYGDGRQVRDWLHVDDHARALLAVLGRGRPGEVYNIGARSERTNLEVVEAICDLLDELRPRPGGERHRERITHVADRPGHDRRYAIDPRKVEDETGWRAELAFEEGLAATVRWYLENEAWWSPIRSNRYRGERLGWSA